MQPLPELENQDAIEQGTISEGEARFQSETPVRDVVRLESPTVERRQDTRYRNVLELDDIAALLEPGAFSPAQCIHADCIETILSLVSRGIDNSTQRRTERTEGRTFTGTITIFAPTVSSRDGHLLIRIGNDDIWDMLRRSGYVSTRVSVKPAST